MTSIYSVTFTLVLFSEFITRWVILAVPTGTLDEGRTDQESLQSIIDQDTMSGNALAAPRFDGLGLGDEERNTKIFILSDIGLKGHTRYGMNTAFSRALPVLRDHAPAEYSLKAERREADLEMRLCMIGRVYRPCWHA